ncbi:unnamed protein product, partial [Meganyctiphanes norvegica]
RNVVLVAMICSFLVGEFPTHLASRASATTLLFPDEPEKLHQTSFRIFKLVVTIFMSLHYSCNFFLYCAFNKRFAGELQRLWNDLGIKKSFSSCCTAIKHYGTQRSTPVYNIGGIISNHKKGPNTAVIHGSVIVTHSNTINILPNPNNASTAANKCFSETNFNSQKTDSSQLNSKTPEGNSSSESTKIPSPLFTKRNQNFD